MKEKNSSQWDKIAKAYQETYLLGIEDIHYGPRCPREKELNLLGDVNGKKIIEIGCGAAQNSIVLAKKGAEVTALDFSRKQLEMGRKLAELERVKISFVLGNFQELENHERLKEYDLAISVYALNFCNSLEALTSTFRQIYKILKAKGLFVFSFDHPIRTCGMWDLDKDVFIIGDYFNRGSNTWKYSFKKSKKNATLHGFSGTMSDIVNATISAGFTLERLLEPLPSNNGPVPSNLLKEDYNISNVADPDSANRLSRIPGTLIIKASK